MAISKIPSAGISNAVNFRNTIINGDMTQSQRGSDINDVAHGGYCTDRFRFHKANTGELVMNFDKVTDVPSSQGFRNSLKLTVGTAESATASNELVGIGQRIEAQNLQYLKYGTSSAETLTLSFWVKSSVTGTYAAFIFQQDASSSPDRRYYSKTFTIDSADTWEKKTIQITGNQDDVITNDNGIGIDFRIILSAGSGLTSGSSDTWGNVTNSAVGQTANFSGTLSATFFLTGVQLEAGTTASDFEFLPHDVNEKRCLRYFEHSYNRGTAPANGVNYANTITTYQGAVYTSTAMRVLVRFQEPKRTTPSATFYYVTGLSGGTTANRWEFWDGSSWNQSSSTTSAGEIEEKGMDVNISHTGLTVGNSNLIGGGWSVDAEL